MRASLLGSISDWQGCHPWGWIWRKPSANLKCQRTETWYKADLSRATELWIGNAQISTVSSYSKSCGTQGKFIVLSREVSFSVTIVTSYLSTNSHWGWEVSRRHSSFFLSRGKRKGGKWRPESYLVRFCKAYPFTPIFVMNIILNPDCKSSI